MPGPWSNQELEILKVSFWAGLSDEEAAAKLPGRTARGTEMKRHRLGLIHYDERNWTAQEDRVLLQLREQGVPYDEIAEDMDRSVMSLRIRYSRLLAQMSSTGKSRQAHGR